MLKIAALLLCVPALWAQLYQSYTISTIAGGGLPVVPSPALSLSIGYVSGIAVDGSGNLYVSDPNASVVFKVNSAGTATIVAGTGRPGYTGDNGPAISAQLNNPGALAFDGSGNLYIADSDNYVIRKISSSGSISTFAGNGTYGYSGDGGPAILAGFDFPQGIAFDAGGNLYIADSGANVVRQISAVGIIVTVAGNGLTGYSGDGGLATSASLSLPVGVAVDAGGNLYIADENNHVVRKVASTGVIGTFAGNGGYYDSGDVGPATTVSIGQPEAVAVDVSGNLLISNGYSRIRIVSASGTITTFAGTYISGYSGDGGAATSAEISNPGAIAALSNGNLYFADSGNYRVREVSTSGVISTVAGDGAANYSGDDGPATSALLSAPHGIAVGSDGTLYIADAGNYRVRKVSPGGVITTVVGDGVAGYTGDNGPATAAEMIVNGIAQDPSGNLFVTDSTYGVVRKIATSGIITTVAGGGSNPNSGCYGTPARPAFFQSLLGIALDATGNMYLSDPVTNSVCEALTDGSTVPVAGGRGFGNTGDGGPAIDATLYQPNGLAKDVAGNLFISDSGDSVIRKVDTAGIISTVPVTVRALNYPAGVAVDTADNLYIADTFNNAIRAVSSGGVLSNLSAFTSGYTGDGGPAINAQLRGPTGIAVGANGVIYVADTGNNVIRALTPCIQALSLSASADATAQTVNLPLNAATSCAWSATALPSWITSASSGTGTGTLSLSVQANTTGQDRSAVFTVNGLLLTIVQAFTQQTFNDVVPADYYFDAVNLLDGKSITSGCGNGGYCPGTVVTRDDMAIFIVRTILGTGTFSYSPTPHFADVPITYFAFPWIQKLYELGITAGCGGTPIDYCPGATVTRDQMAIFIIRARYGPTTMFTWSSIPSFADVPSTYYAFDWIQRMYQDNITAGCGGIPMNYCPVDQVTRGDMAIFLMRAGFDQLLPAAEPVISSISPARLLHGTTDSFTISGVNTSFQQGLTSLVFPVSSGVTVNSLSVTSATTMQVSLTASPTALPGPLAVYEQTQPQEAVLPNGLLIQ